jgi:hypothetical protein
MFFCWHLMVETSFIIDFGALTSMTETRMDQNLQNSLIEMLDQYKILVNYFDVMSPRVS